jgi:hypothetical protein
LPDNHSGQKSAQSHRHAEDRRGTYRDSQRQDQHRQRKELCGCHSVQHSWDQQTSDEENREDEQNQSTRCDSDNCHKGRCGCRRRRRKNRGQENQNNDGEDVFDHQPADRDAAGPCLKMLIVVECTREHDGTRNRKGQAEDDTGTPGEPENPSHKCSQQSCNGALAESSNGRDVPDGEQILQPKVQTHAKHQQDDSQSGNWSATARSAIKPGV